MDDILATAQLLIYAVKENIVPTTTGRMVAINKYKAAFTNIASSNGDRYVERPIRNYQRSYWRIL